MRRTFRPFRTVLAAIVALTMVPITNASGLSNSATRVDMRGYIDVWRLRKDVSVVENAVPQLYDESCETEGDENELVSPDQIRQYLHEVEKCRQTADLQKRQYEVMQAQFNRIWVPILLMAIARGDDVAEVIWRQCSTTFVLDRSWLASTCDDEPERRAYAGKRLRQIGFEPALDYEGEMSHSDQQRIRNIGISQSHVLSRFLVGDFGAWTIHADRGGNVVETDADLEAYANTHAFDTALLEAPRAFTYTSGKGVWTDSLAALRLNRRPATPEVLLWGANTYHGHSLYTGRHDWRGGGYDVAIQLTETTRWKKLGGIDDPLFTRQAHDILKAAEARIDHWLSKDPRWGVFVMYRVGRHEWVPLGMESHSGRLDASWKGHWVLIDFFSDFKRKPIQYAEVDIVESNGQTVLVTSQVDSIEVCNLRYSGGLSFRPENSDHASSNTDTVLGYLPYLSDAAVAGNPGPIEPFVPMSPHKRYRQVLVQCPEGEWPDNRQARFFFLAGDTIVEVMKNTVAVEPLVIRHWRRNGSAQLSEVKRLLQFPIFDAQKTIELLGDAAKKAEARVAFLENASTTKLISTLATDRQSELYYSESNFPDNLVELEDRKGIAGELCKALRAHPEDGVVRFNLVMLLGHQFRKGYVTSDQRDNAADCLLEALSDNHPWVRAEAAYALRFAGRISDLPALKVMLDDSNEDVRRVAHESLMSHSWR